MNTAHTEPRTDDLRERRLLPQHFANVERYGKRRRQPRDRSRADYASVGELKEGPPVSQREGTRLSGGNVLDGLLQGPVFLERQPER